MEASITGHLKGAAEAVLDWFYPPHCYHCGAPLAGGPGRILCGECYRLLLASRVRPPLCSLCGLPVPAETASRKAPCIDCRAAKRHFDCARAIFRYAGPAGSLITSFKFGGAFHLGPRLLERAQAAGWMPTHAADADVVVPVPLHPRRERERGYDQGELLARALGRLMRKPACVRALRRVRYTQQQARLTRAKRLANVHGAFCAGRDSVKGLRVVLVDDVMTTGATAGECARILKRAGAEKVYVLTIARTTP